eukprot:CAMPEP_0114421152 /NCGR_PEP_ID=MMETSP0103-20121206/4927_1 /TAXON_ID=37642 ORGANISM="Paraphysomonas imperforata, Strain PA2" /NCGR_SAMPLE_ID=MMETSP0103 /ASSEMBLY_ACC=CAM_ASM_000201 /LENGTH=455 /DNA_ID=CAMNT_0001589657 /DNA_START=250 /DNA_END=1617 /DNA_ORIENTATION=+
MTPRHSMYIRNSEGQTYHCDVKHESDPDSVGDVSSLVAAPSSDAAMESFQKAFGVIDRLQNVCIIKAIDWWSYEWCHRKEVKQFHLDVDHNAKKHFRNPEWSLGTYVYSDYYSNEFDEETVEEVIDYYEDGQMCDETEKGRKTEVHLRCCSEDRAIHTYKGADGIPTDKILTFQQIRETQTCSYQIDLCTPLLCEEIQHADRPDKLKALTLTDFMEQFRHTCMQRQENWWNYEACFGGLEEASPARKSKAKAKASKNHVVMEKRNPDEKFQGIRQFHVEVVLTKTEKSNEMLQQQVIQAEFVLGKPPLEVYKNATALAEAVHYPTKTSASLRDSHSAQPKLPALHLEFTDGSECDIIENVRRGSTVEVSCGDRDFIEDIIEDRTCHYVIKMTSKLLCRVEGFSPPKKEVSVVTCEPAASQGGESASSGEGDTPRHADGAEEQHLDQMQEQEVTLS